MQNKSATSSDEYMPSVDCEPVRLIGDQQQF